VADEDDSQEEAGSTGPVKPPLSRGRLVGRRIGQVLHWSVVVGIATAATLQLSKQVFFPDPPAAPSPFESCEDGLRGLFDAIHDASLAAEGHDRDPDDEAALERFRAAIQPAWSHRDAVEGLCRGSGHEALLDALERLRYSEEHGVRHQAAELTALRRRVSSMVAASLRPRNMPAPPLEGSGEKKSDIP
jgi:hypothetical protein